MAVMAREVWTDERLDDLNKRVDEGFKENREEFRAVRGEIAGLQRTTFQLFGGIMVTLVLGFGGMIVTFLAQS